MCSIPADAASPPEAALAETRAAERIAAIGQAIDDLAVKTAPEVLRETGSLEDTGPLVARVAELWAQLTELDPEVAKRLAGYQQLWPPPRL
jgi:hypothetical protein